jgi:hypothetical protein
MEEDESLAAVFSNFYLFDSRGIISPCAISVQYPIFYKRKYNFNDIFQSGKILKYDGLDNVQYFKGNIFNSLLFGNMINACSILVRKDCQERIGLFKTKLRNQEDYEYWLRFARHVNIGYVDLSLVGYRRHANQLTAHQNMVQISSNVIEILKPYYDKKNEIFDKRLSRKFCRRFSNVYKNLGIVYLGKREKRSAIDTFRQSIIIDKSNISAMIYFMFSFLPEKITYDLNVYLRIKLKKFILPKK